MTTLAAVLFSVLLPAQSAEELLEAVAASMKEATAVALEAEVRIRIGAAQVAQKAKVVLKRPNLARLELTGAGQDSLIVFDGASTWHYLKAGNQYLESRQKGTAKLEQYGAGIAATLFFEKGVGTLRPYLKTAVVEQRKPGEVETHLVTWKVGTEENSIGIAGRRLVRYRVMRLLQGSPVEFTYLYGEMDLALAAADRDFAFTPPKGARKMDTRDEAGLLAIGSAAPDMVVTDLQGRPVKLSDPKGKVVLVTFWFYG
jgi:hypothetical protein